MIQHRCDLKSRIDLQTKRSVLRTNCRNNIRIPVYVALNPTAKMCVLMCMIKDYDYDHFSFSEQLTVRVDELTRDINKLSRKGVEV